ncbi:MAG: transposase [Moritella sp.]|uniref:IS66 family transposase n=1 Tax=Moritella sp. TaxID=78556 RepID=UPI002172A7C2|nr:transposase [Moritella sp.]
MEKKLKSLKSEERQQLRVKKEELILVQFHKWLVKNTETVTPKSKIGVACSYTLNQRDE